MLLICEKKLGTESHVISQLTTSSRNWIFPPSIQQETTAVSSGRNFLQQFILAKYSGGPMRLKHWKCQMRCENMFWHFFCGSMGSMGCSTLLATGNSNI